MANHHYYNYPNSVPINNSQIENVNYTFHISPNNGRPILPVLPHQRRGHNNNVNHTFRINRVLIPFQPLPLPLKKQKLMSGFEHLPSHIVPSDIKSCLKRKKCKKYSSNVKIKKLYYLCEDQDMEGEEDSDIDYESAIEYSDNENDTQTHKNKKKKKKKKKRKKMKKENKNKKKKKKKNKDKDNNKKNITREKETKAKGNIYINIDEQYISDEIGTITCENGTQTKYFVKKMGEDFKLWNKEPDARQWIKNNNNEPRKNKSHHLYKKVLADGRRQCKLCDRICKDDKAYHNHYANHHKH